MKTIVTKAVTVTAAVKLFKFSYFYDFFYFLSYKGEACVISCQVS